MSDEKPTPTPSPKQKPAPKQRKINLELSKDLQTVYSNGTIVSNTPTEFVMDFVQVLPRMKKGQVVGRVILSPTHAKLFLNALAQNVTNYERQYGEIRIPVQSSLADQFFRAPNPEDDKDGKEGDE